jgi:hypothetical protein
MGLNCSWKNGWDEVSAYDRVPEKIATFEELLAAPA